MCEYSMHCTAYCNCYVTAVMNGSILSSSVEHHVSKVSLRCPVTAVEVIELPGLIYVLVGERPM